MRKEDQITIMVTCAAIVSAGIVGWYYVTDFFSVEHEVSCAVSANRVSQMSITHPDGRPMSPIELHTHLGTGA